MATESRTPGDSESWESEGGAPGRRASWEPKNLAPGNRKSWEPESMAPGNRESWELVRYNIRYSDTKSGRGLFASTTIRQGEVVLSLPQVTRSERDRYSLEAWAGIHIDCSNTYAGAVNHSCNPNAAVRNGNIVAWACIQAGDEISIDYHKTEHRLAEPFDCECGARNCRGRIE